MARLIVGNRVNGPYLKDVSAEELRHIAAQGQRLVWCAEPGDSLVLALRPDPGHLSYIAGVLGLDTVPEVIVPPEGEYGPDVLTGGSFADGTFLANLRDLVRDKGIESIEPFYFDGYISRLARRLDLTKGTPGFDFLDQGGHELLNSKVVFRAIAAGIGLPVPEGMVTGDQDEAVDFLWRLLESGRPAIVKQDMNVGGLGNEVLSPTPGIDHLGALHCEIIADRASLAAHVARRWPWYTDGLMYRVVLEEYVADSVPIWGEASITDESVRVFGNGKVRMRPVCDGVVIPVPPPGSQTDAFPGFLANLEALAVAMRSMGYRGLTNIDAVITPDGRVLFNEFNARYGGSTHLFAIGERVVGGDYLADRCLIERRECAFPAFDVALRRLTEHGLAYDPATRTGVLIQVYGTRLDGLGGEACIVGENVEAAEEIERALVELFPH